ncbi:hypothetical protein QJQ45_029539, partial [Haematococcus lacustris]
RQQQPHQLRCCCVVQVTSRYIQVTQCTRLRVALASLMTGLGYAVGADFTLQPVCRVNQASASRGWFYKVNLDMSAAAATALYETMWDESIGELGTGVAPFISSARVLCGGALTLASESMPAQASADTPQLLTIDCYSALHALYHHEDASVKDQANKWLEQWQQSVAAWSISDAVLHDTASSVEAQYFCAQTLRTKVQRDFEELPLDSVPGLRESLVSLLLSMQRVRPLCARSCAWPGGADCAPAGTALGHTAGPGAAMGGPVTWLAQRLQGESADLSLPCLLELLTVMPQASWPCSCACDAVTSLVMGLCVLSGDQQLQVRAVGTWPPGIAPEAAARLRPAVLSAFSSWLRLSEGAAMGPDGSALPSHPLVRAALEGLGSSGPLFSACVDAVSELVWVSVDPESLAITPLMMPLVQALVPAVMALRPRFRIALSRAAAEEGNGDGSGHARQDGGGDDPWDDDDAAVMKMALLFAELGEAYLHLIATAVQEVQGPVEALLEVAAHPEARVAALSFNFWHKLAKALTSGWGPRDVGADSAPADSSPSASHAVPPADVAAGEMPGAAHSSPLLMNAWWCWCAGG